MIKRKKIIGFIALSIAMFMGTLDSTIVNVALPDITKYFNASLNDTSWISTIYVLGLAIFMITASKLADQFGRKKLMMIGLVLFGASSALCGLSQSLLFLISMRFLQALGGAIITPIVVPMGLDIFGKENTQKVAGLIGAVTALAAAGGPPIGGLLIEYINWQAIFFVNVPFSIIALLLSAFFVDESYDDTTTKSIDWLGMITLTTTLFLLTFALLKGNDYGWKSHLIISMLIGSVISSILFLIIERKIKAPMVDLTLFKEKTFTSSTICYLISGFGIASPMLIFNYFLQNAVGYAVLESSFIVMAMALTVAVSMPLGNVISSKFGANPVNFLGVLGMAFGIFLLSRLNVDSSKSIMIADMIACGFGLGFSCQSLVSSIKYIPQEKSGMGSGIVNAARQVGTCIGIALLVTILDIHVTDAKIDIKSNAINDVNNNKVISQEIKSVMIQDIETNLDTSDNNASSDTSDLQDTLKNDVTNTVNNITNIPRPQNNDTLEKLYDGAQKLSDGTKDLSDGQSSLDEGINSMNSGFDKLLNGSITLTNGASKLQSGISNTLSGTQKLSDAAKKLGSLNTGINSLTDGIYSVASGTNLLFNQFNIGTSNQPTLKDKITSLNQGAVSLFNGLSALNQQFSDGTSENPTLKYNINQLNSAAQSTASQFKEDSANNLKYMVDSLNSDTNGVSSYVNTSNAIIQALRNSTDSSVYSSVMSQLINSMDKTLKKSLATTLVLITNTADTKADVTFTTTAGSKNLTQTQATILLLGSSGYDKAEAIKAAQDNYDKGGEVIVSSIQTLDQQFSPGTAEKRNTLFDAVAGIATGTQALSNQMNTIGKESSNTLADNVQLLNSGARQIADGTGALEAQMNSGKSSGTETLYDKVSDLNSGAQKLAKGAEEINSGTAKLGDLKSGIDSLVNALQKLENGSTDLVSGTEDLQSGIKKAKDGSSDLIDGSSKLIDASTKLEDGASDLVIGIGKAGQKDAIKDVIDNIKSDKNDQITGAFSNTFIVAAVIMAILSLFGLFTDKRNKETY